MNAVSKHQAMTRKTVCTNSLMTGAPTVLTRWMESCRKNTMSRREGMMLSVWGLQEQTVWLWRQSLVDSKIFQP